MQNYFELFSLQAGFDIDLKDLEGAYQKQIIQYHPDKFASKDTKQQSVALQNTSLINDAFATLKSPLLRGTYLLELQGINAFDEKDTQMQPDFLIMQIELRELLEVLEKTKDEIKLDDFIENIEQKIEQNIAKIKQAFANNALIEVKNLVRELKFYSQLSAQAKQLTDEWL